MRITSYSIDIGGILCKLLATYLISIALVQPFLYVLLIVLLLNASFTFTWKK